MLQEFSDEEPRALFTHCYGHALNLADRDSIKQYKLMKDALDTTYKISNLVKYSPKRNTILKTLAPDTSGFRILSRRTVRANTLKSVIDN